MKKIIKVLFQYLRLLIQTLYSFLLILKFKVKPMSLKKESIAQDIFILGNGPSLKEQLHNHKEELLKKDILGVNEFCLSDYFKILKPKYYVIIDQAYFKKEEVVEKFFIIQQKILKAFSKNISWDITIFIPIIAENKEEWFNLKNSNKRIKIELININIVNGFDIVKNFLYSKNMGMPRAQNVLISSIFLAINMKYKNIFLLGADHSMHQNIVVNENSDLCIATQHFNHSDYLKPFYSDYLEENILRVDQFFLMWSLTFQGYYELKKYAKVYDIQVYNTSINSFIDAFPKIKLEKVLKV